MKSAEKRYLPSILEGKIKPIAAVISALGVIIGGCMGVAGYVSARVDEQFETHLAPVEEQLDTLRLESARTQLVTLIKHYDGDKKAVLDAAEYYFVTLGGDLYLTGMFKEFADEQGWNVDYIFIAKKAKWGNDD